MEFGKAPGEEVEETRFVSAETIAAEHRGKLKSFILSGRRCEF
jgi:hypothetical protein